MYPLKIKEKYDSSNLESLWYRFSTVYLWNYISWDYREWVWSHLWVDIIPLSSWQDIVSVLDGVVFKTWEDWAYGKYVFIEHIWVPDPDDFSKTTTLYSCNLHLSSVNIKTWDIVKEWQIIWKTWNTWISYWEHLHFQIDKKSAPFHAYWPYTWAEVAELWIWFSEGVNKALWLDKAKLYTINPLVYLDKIEELWLKIKVINQNKTEEKTEEKLDIKRSDDIVIDNNIVNISSNTTNQVINNTPKTEEKLEIKKSDDMVITNSSDLLNSMLDDESKKKTWIEYLKI